MFKSKKLIVALGVLFVTAFTFSMTSFADETVPGSFTTTGELATPEITVLGLYNQANSLVSTSSNVTPNTKHSIRFELTNATYAFDDMLITVAFFESSSGSRDDFDQVKDFDRTNINGDDLVIRFGYQGGVRQDLEIVYNNSYGPNDISWDDNFFDAGDDVVEFEPTDKEFEFEIYFNMSKVADVNNTYYIGAFASQGIPGQDDRFATYSSEGPYYTNSYTEFSLASTTLSWELAEGETFLDFDGDSESSTETIDGGNMSFISNEDFSLSIYADTTWTGEDPESPGDFLSAYLTYFPQTQQEFAIEVSESSSSGSGISLDGDGNTVGYYEKTSESGINGVTLYLYLLVNTENFQDGTYSGDIYLEIYSYIL